MKKIIYIFFAMTMFFVVTGCSLVNNHSSVEEINISMIPTSPEVLERANTLSESVDNANVLLSAGPVSVNTVEDWLVNVGKVKFHESMTPVLKSSHAFTPFDMTELSVPIILSETIQLESITANWQSNVNFVYFCSEANETFRIRWSRSIGPEFAYRAQYLDVRGEPYSHEVVVHNGITYGISEWINWDESFWGYGASWSQYGKTFGLSLPYPFTRDDIFEIARMRQVEAWELDGDAVSVSVQGMENVRIFEQSADFEALGAAVPMGAGNELIVVGDVLYRGGQGRAMERVGYRWLIDAELGRYQYVLMPGMYTFQADGVVGAPGLTIRHFEGGDAVSVADYSDALVSENAGGFYLTVTPDAGETDLRTSPSERSIFEVSSHEELQYAVQHLVTQGIREQTTITMMQDFTATGNTIVVPANVNIVFTSAPGNVFTYTRTITGRHFSVTTGGILTLKDVVICGGAASNLQRGGIEAARGGRLIIEEGSIIRNNNNFIGGGVTTWMGSEVVMRGGVIEGNRASHSGGGVDANGAAFVMEGGIIRNNQAAQRGGGIVVQSGSGVFNMYGGVIDSNTAPLGGAISVWYRGAVNIRGTSETAVISNNEAILDGGGVFFDVGRISTMVGGAIVNNRAGRNGGGVFISESSHEFLHISDEFVISGNQAPNGDDIWEPGMGQRDGVNMFAYDEVEEIDFDALRAFAERYGFDFELMYLYLTGAIDEYELFEMLGYGDMLDY